MAINAYYFIGTMSGVYTKVYDGKKLQADVLTYDGYLNTDSFQAQITDGNIAHVNQYGTMEYDETLGKNVGTLDLLYDDGYPKVFRNGVDVTSEYNQTQVKDYTFENKDPGNMTFTIISRDVTLQSANLTKEYDGKALTAYSQAGGTDVTDSTAGQTDKGYVSGEEFAYTFTGSQLFVGSSDNEFDVDNSATALTSDYNVTKQYGTLTVTGRTVPLTITVADQEKTYDGTTVFDTTAYTVSGELAYGDTITVTLSNSKVDAGDYTDAITASYKIMHDNGDGTKTDVTDMYLNVTVDAGDFTINKRNVTITSASDSKVYDGTPLTNDNTAITSGSFVSGEGYVANVTGSQTAIGTSPNYFTVEAAAGTNLNNYNITKVEGTLTVTGWDQLVTITADSNDKMYDGTALTDSGYTVTNLAAGHTATVTVSGEITHFGTADNVVSSYTIYDENGEDVTAAYTNVQTEKGTLSITKRDVTLTSASDEKPYDGTPLTNSNVTVSGDGFAGTEGATYTVTGSQTEVGSSANTFSYVLNSNTSADDYAIHTVEGTLTVTEAEFIITIDTEIGSGLEFLYDNTSTKVLTDDQYQVEGLVKGDKVVNVTITTSLANAGTYTEDDYTLTYDIVNAAGVSVKSNYNITEYKHDVDITKRTITIEADSASKVYDSTALTCYTYTVTQGETEEYQLFAGEYVEGVGFTADSTITHAGSTANKIDATNVTITKADGTDSSMNYNILTEDGTLTVTQRGVMLISTSAEKFYDGTALQNRQVVATGFEYDENGNVVIDEDGGFLAGDGCTYDFVNDTIVIDANGNIIAWTVSEQSDTAYGQTDVGTSKNEFNYNNFTSAYAGSLESDYLIMYGFNQEELGLSKEAGDLFGDLTVWGGPVEINMTDYSWTYDYQAKTNGYFDDGYTVVFTTNEEGTETEMTSFAHNSEGEAVALFGKDTIVVTVTGQGGGEETGKVQHVGEDKQNVVGYTIYRNGEDVTEEVQKYYQISVDGGLLQITPRTVTLFHDGENLVEQGFIFGEGANYESNVGTAENSATIYSISELLTDTREEDYTIGKVFVADSDSWTLDQDVAFEEVTMDNAQLTAADGFTVNATKIAVDGESEIVGVIGHNDGAKNTAFTLAEGASVKISGAMLDEIQSRAEVSVAGGAIDVSEKGTTGDVRWAVTQGLAAASFDSVAATSAELTTDIAFAADSWRGNKKADSSITTGAGTTVTIDTDSVTFFVMDDTIAVGKDAMFTMDEATVDFGTGDDTLAVGARSQAALGDITNVEYVKLSSGTATAMTTLTAGDVTLSTPSGKVTLGNYATASFDLLDFSNGSNKLTVGANSDLTAKKLAGKLATLTATAGTSKDHTTLTADGGKISGTSNANAFSFGNYVDADLGDTDLALGKGDDSLTIGSRSTVTAGALDFGSGTKDALKIGSGSTLVVESLDNLEKLTLSTKAGKEATLCITDLDSFEAAQAKWGSKYGSQIVNTLA